MSNSVRDKVACAHRGGERGAAVLGMGGVAAPAPVRDGRAPANRSLGDSWFTTCEGLHSNSRRNVPSLATWAGPTHHRKMDRFASVGMPRPLVAPLPKALASQHHDHSLPLRPWSIGARTLLESVRNKRLSRHVGEHRTAQQAIWMVAILTRWVSASIKHNLTFVEPVRIT
jgi:hypothetical protein